MENTEPAGPSQVVVTSRSELDAVLRAHDTRPRPDHGKRVVVMTMGALHSGHLELVRQARRVAGDQGQVVVTIFVNPLQFGPSEDLDRYPRDLDGDMAKLASVGADVVFAPTVDVMYPGGDPLVTVSAGRMGTVLEGAARPGHFDGVLTVVLKLLHLTRPDAAMFGQKDAQQLVAVRRMVRDLDVGVEIIGVPIVRDDDGVALSSRNAYLSAGQRISARALSRALEAARRSAEDGAAAVTVLTAARGILDAEPGVEVDYAELVDPGTLEPVESGDAILVVAAKVGSTRLIDNTTLTIHAPSSGDAGKGIS